MNDIEHPPIAIAARRPARSKPARATMVAKAGPVADRGAWQTIRFGDVTITAQRPSDEEIRRNVEASTAALKRALPAFLHPGLHIEPKKDVPLFWADEDNPADGVIRQLNGKIERGVLDEDGTFKAIDCPQEPRLWTRFRSAVAYRPDQRIG